MSENLFWALVGIAASIILMVFELAFLTRWLKSREANKEKSAWEPFRALLLGTIVRHLDELNALGRLYIAEVGAQLALIRQRGALTADALAALRTRVLHLQTALRTSKQEFFFGIQTAAPSLKPEAASYCGEAFFFGQLMEEHFSRAAELVTRLTELPDPSSDAAERPLSELKVIVYLIEMMLGFRFAAAKRNFVQYVWKQEQLHYFESDGIFYSPHDYKRALEREKTTAELKAIPRDTPIKRFFDPE